MGRAAGHRLTLRGALAHVACVAAGVFVLLGVPALATGALPALVTGQSPDTISSATTTLDAPSGTYLVYINKDVHDAESLATWETFYTDYQDFTFSMEDVACEVARGDTGAQDMAASLQSLLPEHQMQLTVSDPTMLLSRMAYGKYDMVVMSKEFVDAHGSVDGGNCEVLEVSGAAATTEGGQ